MKSIILVPKVTQISFTYVPVISAAFFALSLLTLSSCSSVSEQSSQPAASPPVQRKPAATTVSPAEIQMEGGIVGTGNEEECKNSDNKLNCNDNIK